MAEQPSEQAAEKIRSVLRELSAQHGLDADARAELFSHLEEKLTGYLSGSVKITEADALILARSHFGDTQQIAAAIAKEGGRGAFGIPWLNWPASPRSNGGQLICSAKPRKWHPARRPAGGRSEV